MRVGLAAIVVTIVNSSKDAQGCLAAYTASVSFLAVYAIIQEFSFAIFGTPITAPTTFGLFAGASEQTERRWGRDGGSEYGKREFLDDGIHGQKGYGRRICCKTSLRILTDRKSTRLNSSHLGI